MGCLHDGVPVGEEGSGRSQPEPELTEEALALPHPQIDFELSFEVGGEGLAVPEGAAEPDVLGALSQRGLNGPHLRFGETSRTAGAIALGESRESLLLESTEPVLDGPGGIPQHPADLGGGHTLGDEEETVEPMVVARFVRSSDLVLEG